MSASHLGGNHLWSAMMGVWRPPARYPPYSKLPTPYSFLPTPYSPLPTPYSLILPPSSHIPTPNSHIPTPNSLNIRDVAVVAWLDGARGSAAIQQSAALRHQPLQRRSLVRYILGAPQPLCAHAQAREEAGEQIDVVHVLAPEGYLPPSDELLLRGGEACVWLVRVDVLPGVGGDVEVPVVTWGCDDLIARLGDGAHHRRVRPHLEEVICVDRATRAEHLLPVNHATTQSGGHPIRA
mmetsp:Transcript_3994/g.8995  ORF Transcript_3994/g.8995 Transcript_3994/m.8995 type:complete len:237 (+) Transcript_3994:98-808(+)